MRVERTPGHAQIAAHQPQLDVLRSQLAVADQTVERLEDERRLTRPVLERPRENQGQTVGAERQGRDIRFALLVVGVEAVRQHDAGAPCSLARSRAMGSETVTRRDARANVRRSSQRSSPRSGATRRRVGRCVHGSRRSASQGIPSRRDNRAASRCVVAGGDVLMMASAPDSRASRSIVGYWKSQGHASSGNDTSC